MAASDLTSESSVLLELDQLVGEVSVLAREDGREDLAARLQQQTGLDRRPGLKVVVAGETKTGKSSVINGLLGRSDLLPVNDSVATNVHIMIRHQPTTGARVYFDNGDATDIPIEEIGDWASVQGNPFNRKGVRLVEVGADAPFLANGLQLFDTPGVGGLESGHSKITMEALSHADVLMFVVKSTEPLTLPELVFLQEATKRIDSVVFVFTKIDLSPDWPAILDENRARLADRAPGYRNAPFVPVSCKVKEAVDLGLLDAASLPRSGFPALEAQMAQISDRWWPIRVGNLLRVVGGVIDLLAVTEATILDEDPTLEAGLEQEKSRLEALVDGGARWPRQLADEIDRVKHEVDHDARQGIVELRHRQEGRAQGFVGSRDAFIEGLIADVRALTTMLDGRIQDEISQLEHTLALTVTIPGVDLDPRTFPDVGSLDQLELLVAGRASPAGSSKQLTNWQLTFGFLSDGLTINTLGHLVLGLASAAPLGFIIAGGVTFIKVVERHRLERIQQLESVIVEAIESCQLDIPHAIAVHLDDARRLLNDAAKARIDQQEKVVRAALENLQRLRAGDAETRRAAQESARRHQARLEDLRAKIERAQAHAGASASTRSGRSLDAAAAGIRAQGPVNER